MKGIKGSGPPKRRWTMNGLGVYSCPYCDHTSPSPQGIGRHVATVHAEAEKAARCANGAMTAAAKNPDRVEQAMTTNPATLMGYNGMTEETRRVRKVCNAAVSLMLDPRYRELLPELKRDVLAVLRMRLAEETATPEALLTGDLMTDTLDPVPIH